MPLFGTICSLFSTGDAQALVTPKIDLRAFESSRTIFINASKTSGGGGKSSGGGGGGGSSGGGKSSSGVSKSSQDATATKSSYGTSVTKSSTGTSKQSATSANPVSNRQTLGGFLKSLSASLQKRSVSPTTTPSTTRSLSPQRKSFMKATSATPTPAKSPLGNLWDSIKNLFGHKTPTTPTTPTTPVVKKPTTPATSLPADVKKRLAWIEAAMKQLNKSQLGAGAITRRENGVSNLSPWAASTAIAAKDQARVEALEKAFEDVQNATGVPAEILAGIASRETHVDEPGILTKSGYSPEPGNAGFGVMQVDQKAHPGTAGVGPTSEATITEAADIFNSGLNEVQQQHPTWSAADQLQAAVDRYNGGRSTNLSNLDAGSTGGDYGGDVLARALNYGQNVFDDD